MNVIVLKKLPSRGFRHYVHGRLGSYPRVTLGSYLKNFVYCYYGKPFINLTVETRVVTFSEKKGTFVVGK